MALAQALELIFHTCCHQALVTFGAADTYLATDAILWLSSSLDWLLSPPVKLLPSLKQFLRRSFSLMPPCPYVLYVPALTSAA